MSRSLFTDISEAFRKGEAEAVSDLLTSAVNRAAERMAEANRQRLTEFWRDLAAVHYATERLELAPDLREKRGYLEAIVHLSRAVRDLSDDLEAIEKVKKCVHGPKILAIIAKEGTIQHGELAERLDIAAPSLTQAIRAVAESKTITGTVHGKFKYYSLTPLGSLVARKLEGGTALKVALESMRDTVGRRLGALATGLPKGIEPEGRITGHRQQWSLDPSSGQQFSQSLNLMLANLMAASSPNACPMTRVLAKPKARFPSQGAQSEGGFEEVQGQKGVMMINLAMFRISQSTEEKFFRFDPIQSMKGAGHD